MERIRRDKSLRNDLVKVVVLLGLAAYIFLVNPTDVSLISLVIFVLIFLFISEISTSRQQARSHATEGGRKDQSNTSGLNAKQKKTTKTVQNSVSAET